VVVQHRNSHDKTSEYPWGLAHPFPQTNRACPIPCRSVRSGGIPPQPSPRDSPQSSPCKGGRFITSFSRIGFIDAFAGSRAWPQGLKPAFLAAASGTAEAVPFPKLDQVNVLRLPAAAKAGTIFSDLRYA
jgi:hypothetical protein